MHRRIADSPHESKLAAFPSEKMRAAAMTEPGNFEPELANTACELSAFRDAPWQMSVPSHRGAAEMGRWAMKGSAPEKHPRRSEASCAEECGPERTAKTLS